LSKETLAELRDFTESNERGIAAPYGRRTTIGDTLGGDGERV
jgi:hypothetical protein